MAGTSPAMTIHRKWDRLRGGLAVLDEAVEVQPDVRGFRRRMGECDRLVERSARLLGASELHEQRALHAEEMEIAGERRGERLDHRQGGGRPLDLADGDGAVERDDG